MGTFLGMYFCLIIYGYLGFSTSMGLQAQKSVLTRLCTRRKFPFSSVQKRKKLNHKRVRWPHVRTTFFSVSSFFAKMRCLRSPGFFAQTRHINRFPLLFCIQHRRFPHGQGDKSRKKDAKRASWNCSFCWNCENGRILKERKKKSAIPDSPRFPA